MERFFEVVVPFLIAALFVLRLLSLIRRRRRDGQRRERAAAAPAEAAGGAARGAAHGAVSWEDEFRDNAPAGAVVEGPPAAADEDFSAWNLSVDDEPAPPPRLPETPRLSPLTAAPAPAPALSGVVPLAAVPEQTPPRRAAPARRLEQRLRGLPLPQQGVVWAELLGSPRGLA